MKRFYALVLAAVFALAALGAYAQAPTCPAGVKGAPLTATIAFTAPTLNTDGTPIATPLSYQVFTGTAAGAETLLSTVTTSPVTVTAGLKANSTLFVYVVTKDANGVLSAPSNEVCKNFAGSVPGAVVITIT